MHELSLMQNIVDIIEKSAAEEGLERITKVRLVVGEMSSAVPTALRFAFESIKPGTVFEEAELDIERQEIKLECQDCQHVFSSDSVRFVCPRCESRRIEVLQGEDLYIDFYEGT